MYFLFPVNDSKLLYENTIFIDNPDRAEYISPIDNLIDSGSYSLTENGEPYAGRLPGFVFPYIFFRLLFASKTSMILLGLFALALSLFASLKLSELMLKWTNSMFATIATLFALEFFSYYWHWDWTLHPNSISSSSLILSICYLFEYFQLQKNKHLLLAGTFLAWLFMLRGFTFLLLPVTTLCILLFMKQKGLDIKKIMKSTMILLFPVLLFESCWVLRNFISLHQFIPLQTSFVPGANSSNAEYGYGSYTKYSMTKLREMINCWGGDNFWYFQSADMKWFTDPEIKTKASDQFSKRIFSKDLTPEMLDELKGSVIFSLDKNLTQQAHDSLEDLIIKKSIQNRKTFMETKSSYFYFIAPFKRINNLLAKNTVQDWPGISFKNSSVIQKAIKLSSLGIYFLSLIAFLFFSIYKFKRIRTEPFLLMLFLYTISTLLVFGFVINSAHYSYYIFGYIPSIPMILYLINDLFNSKRNIRNEK